MLAELASELQELNGEVQVLEKVTVCWYRVYKCGYYKAPLDPEPALPYSLSTMLRDLKAWSAGRALTQTLTFGTQGEAGDGDRFPVYLQDIRGKGDDWLLTLWNETPANEGAVMSLPGDSLVGGTKVFENEIKKGSIPGYATYFYIRPNDGLIAGVRLTSQVYGHEPMRRFLEGFLTRFTRRVCGRFEDGELVIEGYAQNPAEDEPKDFQPRFSSGVFKQRGERELLIERARDIRKVVRKTTLNSKRAPDRAMWQSVMTLLGEEPEGLKADPVQMKYEVGRRMDPDEVRELADWWDEQGDNGFGWDDIGFKLIGEQSPRWLSHSTAKMQTSLEVDRLNPELVEPESFLKELHRCRDELLSVIKD